jgi:GNAT superfamily N-acetyltransferase
MAALGPVLSEIVLRPFQAGDEGAFRRLNEEWIAAYFGMEEKDRVVLSDPFGQILKPGGAIFMAIAGDTPVGCCALLWMRPCIFEVAKMAVERSHRGFGIGRKILEYTIAQARARSATSLYLETNQNLANAIHLYESLGFRHVPPERVVPSPYARANVFMEMVL